MRQNSPASTAGTETPPVPRLALADYFIIECLNAIASTFIGTAIYFWTRKRFEFSDTENLLAAALYGLVYTVGARYGGKLSDRLGLDRTLRLALAALAVALGIGVRLSARWTPFALLAFHGLVVAPVWTSLEGSIAHAAGVWTTARRVGVYNIVWGGANTLAILLAGALLRWQADALIWGAALLHGAGWLWTFRRRVAARTPSSAPLTVAISSPPPDGARRRRLAALALVGNSLAYLLQYVFFALLPHLAHRTNWTSSYVLWLTLAFFLARALAFAALSHWTGWHDHPAWSHGALWLAPCGIALVFAWPVTAVALSALALTGAAFGLTYYASIYYTLEAGTRKGTQSGIHEAALGLGGFLGPLVGAGAVVLLGDARAALFAVAGVAAAVNAIAAAGIYARIKA